MRKEVKGRFVGKTVLFEKHFSLKSQFAQKFGKIAIFFLFFPLQSLKMNFWTERVEKIFDVKHPLSEAQERTLPLLMREITISKSSQSRKK